MPRKMWKFLEKDLPVINQIRSQQEPTDIGKGIEMSTYDVANKHPLPHSCGNPWVGAYSRHGFWYKFHQAEEKDFNKIVAWAIDTDQWSLQYEEFYMWQEAFGDGFECVVAKNQRDDVMGGIAYTKYGKDIGWIGVYWLMEDWRHSGIGTQLFKHAMKRLAGRNIGIFGVSHLWEKIRDRFGFRNFYNWQLDQIIVNKPKGFLNLKTEIEGVEIIKHDDPKLDKTKLLEYDQKIVGSQLNREPWLMQWLNHPDGHARLAITKKGEVVGMGVVKEAAGGWTKRLVVGPLYANDDRIAKALLYSLLYNYYDEEDRPDWNPNLQAIQWREIYFYVISNNSVIRDICGLLKGEEGNVTEYGRFWYKGQFTKETIDFDSNKVFCVSDWQMAPV